MGCNRYRECYHKVDMQIRTQPTHFCYSWNIYMHQSVCPFQTYYTMYNAGSKLNTWFTYCYVILWVVTAWFYQNNSGLVPWHWPLHQCRCRNPETWRCLCKTCFLCLARRSTVAFMDPHPGEIWDTIIHSADCRPQSLMSTTSRYNLRSIELRITI